MPQGIRIPWMRHTRPGAYFLKKQVKCNSASYKNGNIGNTAQRLCGIAYIFLAVVVICHDRFLFSI